MKKLIRRGSLLLASVVLASALAACGGSSTNNSSTNNNSTSSTESTLTNGSGSDMKQAISIAISQFVEHDALDDARNGFLERLAELGYVEGENLTVDLQNAQGEPSNAQTIAQSIAADASELDLILGIATPSAEALVNLIDDVPILITAVTDPESSHLVVSNEAPGGNVTGTSDLNPIKEQIDLLVRLVPDVENVAVMYAASESNSVFQGELAMNYLAEIGLTGTIYSTPNSNDLQSVIESSIGRVDAWYIPTDNIFASSMSIVRQVAVDAQIPVIAGEVNAMNNGALATVSLDYYTLGVITADMAIEILEEGADPATMPIRYQEDPAIHVNEEFAAEIGLEIPEDILAEAGAN